ncbi:methylaspartate mutase subunit E [Candidatus Izemoplasma sp. B36]|uniref:methylaspartate mutase subunit E n=1 Tax=Candidatus Izemoplasma sp. B36 TaxID=3242468 RepID=UPI0035584B49
MKLRNKKLTENEFLKIRKEVLKSWVTGNDSQLNLKAAVKYLKSIPEEKNFAIKLNNAKKEGVTLVQPRAGVPVLDEHIKLLQYLEKSGADFVPSTVDSYTRQNRYNEAQKGLEESMQRHRALLNGFPVVNQGVANCKKVLESVGVPIEARHGTPDARLLSEIIHAAGWTSNEGGGISYNIPYAKNIPLEESIRNWQYCDRLVGYYEERGIKINREPFGPLTGTIVPPSISNTVMIIETLLAAEQGVKNITVGYGMGGNLIQDVAAIKALYCQTIDYLDKFGYKDMEISTVFHQWMGGFPQDEAEAMALISYSSTVAALSKTTKLITKSPHESIGIPTKEANGLGVKASKFIVNMLKDQSMEASNSLNKEIKQIKKEVSCLIDVILNVGKGDLAVGTVKAFEQGLIDIPFAPSNYNAGKILPARDNDGRIRILEFGNLGFSEEIKAFHRKKIAKRAKKEGREVSFQLTVDDVYSVSKGKLIGRPKVFK